MAYIGKCNPICQGKEKDLKKYRERLRELLYSAFREENDEEETVVFKYLAENYRDGKARLFSEVHGKGQEVVKTSCKKENYD